MTEHNRLRIVYKYTLWQKLVIKWQSHSNAKYILRNIFKIQGILKPHKTLQIVKQNNVWIFRYTFKMKCNALIKQSKAGIKKK